MEKSLFIIQRITGYDCEGENKTIVATRHTTKKAIEEEVDHLNNVIDDVEMPESGNSSWSYFDFEELIVSPKGEYKWLASSSQKDAVLNMAGLRNAVKGNFDHIYSFYVKAEHLHSDKTLESYLQEQYSRFLSGDVYLSDVLGIAEEFQRKGMITSDISVVRASLGAKSMESRLAEKFVVKGK
ncbi:hypothetical protein [Serratia sp. Se-RSBMAAmG]|uniref:hypothetical protein n=1 Tax=Serratia sp. Se-RSBMAAmG TaxID=3043305 RepID=UPI0024AFC5D2|nr:hypothetical protein [Serratia sp. Se-RSBMAAmG]MDI6977093.1 hypothetical protein [Serratia sp. Se-RSBMAAmG]